MVSVEQFQLPCSEEGIHEIVHSKASVFFETLFPGTQFIAAQYGENGHLTKSYISKTSDANSFVYCR